MDSHIVDKPAQLLTCLAANRRCHGCYEGEHQQGQPTWRAIGQSSGQDRQSRCLCQWFPTGCQPCSQAGKIHDLGLEEQGADKDWQMWWKDVKMRMCLFVGIIILLIVIIVPAGMYATSISSPYTYNVSVVASKH